MFLLKDNKLFIKDGEKYTSIDIISGEVKKNNIEVTTDTKDGQILTHREVYAKFHVNASVPTLSKDYLFPKTQIVKNETVDENANSTQGEPKKTSNSKSKK